MATKKLISFNVNGIRASVNKGFYDTMRDLNPDFMCLQETKAQDDQVKEALKNLEGYHMVVNSATKKGYSGTCILSKEAPISTSIDIGVEEHDDEGRVTRMEFNDYNIVNVYVPNSGSELKRLDYRAEWDVAFTNYLANLAAQKPLLVTGDFNVAHRPIDLARPQENYDKTYKHWSELNGQPIMVDEHPNALAHRIIAEEIARVRGTGRGRTII